MANTRTLDTATYKKVVELAKTGTARAKIAADLQLPVSVAGKVCNAAGLVKTDPETRAADRVIVSRWLEAGGASGAALKPWARGGRRASVSA